MTAGARSGIVHGMDRTNFYPPNREEYNQLVWEIVRQIPPGKVMTYGQIAALIPAPPGMDPAEYAAYRARWVGSAMAQSPAGVPWQRVLAAHVRSAPTKEGIKKKAREGKISVNRGRLWDRQHDLLVAEGVVFDARGRADLERFGWSGPSAEWLFARGYLSPDSAG